MKARGSLLEDRIKDLNADAARILLALRTNDGAGLHDLPMVIKRAGLSTRGKNRYGRAYQQVEDLIFLALPGGLYPHPPGDLNESRTNQQPDVKTSMCLK
ncbi:MAG TPA: hypothetical protein VKR06_38005 [Ktedonosporobacter sp.]|nr:hypothetical protein [Ktedonosporobacter sp.]